MGKEFINIPLSFKQDDRVKQVLEDWGVEGYGIIISLIEAVSYYNYYYDDECVELLSDELGISEYKISTIIIDYDVFSLEGDDNQIVCKVLEDIKNKNVVSIMPLN